MRTLLLTCVVLLLGCADDVPVVPLKLHADLVLFNARVITMDPELGSAQAIAVAAHKIIAVGSDEDVQGYVGDNTRVIDLDGKTVIPGLIEGHGHFLGVGRAKQVLDLASVGSYQEILDKVGVAADAAQPGEWIFGMGWHQDKWADQPQPAVQGVPTNQSLSVLSPNNPVLLNHASGHAAFANDAALGAAGIDLSMADPAGGTIVRDATGKATGLLRETAQRIVGQAVASYHASLDPEEQQRVRHEQVFLAGKEALRYGITSFHDAGSDFATIDYFKTLEDNDGLPVRLYVMVRGESNAQMADKLAQYYMPLQGNDFLTVRSIKRQIDGALGAHGAWLLEPYEDLTDSAGLVLEPVADIEGTAALALAHGFQVNTHAIGTRANREVLDLYERAWKKVGVSGQDLRWRVEHAQHVHADDVARFGKLGVVAAVQGVHATSDGPWIASRLGQKRTEATSYRWRDLLDSGAILGNGTDVPVESINPFASIYASVARVMNTGAAFYPSQAMSREEALYSYTMGNAYAAFEASQKGSITPGKLADFAVLDRDILSVPVDQIPLTQVQYTIVGGEVRYDAHADR